MNDPLRGSPATMRQRRHLLTVAVEDYFQVVAFSRLIDANNWYRFERRIERNTKRTLDLLDEFDVKATFFALGGIIICRCKWLTRARSLAWGRSSL